MPPRSKKQKATPTVENSAAPPVDDSAPTVDSLLLSVTNEEEEVDEPIVATETVLLPSNDTEEEQDEPISTSISENHDTSKNEDILMATEEEQDEVDEPILDIKAPTDISAITDAHKCSEECHEAMSAISADCWDISSWIIFYEEVQQGRGGDVTIEEVYERIITQFPRSARFWKNLAEYYIQNNEYEKAEETFKKSLTQCRNVDLWKSYLNFHTSNFQNSLRIGIQSDQYQINQNKCDALYKEAIHNIGLSLNSYPIWREYINFVKNWPENGLVESGKKLRTLRELYQQAICIAMDQSDEIWTEYEIFEKTTMGEQAAENILPDFNRKYLHARSIMRERKKLMSNIVFDRLATPPTGALIEMQQLEHWGHWISFEMSCPDYLNLESFIPMLRLIYDQCLCCFRYNPEVWAAYGLFEAQEVPRRSIELQQMQLQQQLDSTAIDEIKKSAIAGARRVYLAGIDANPAVTLLRCALAELEETSGDLDAAKEVFRVTFEQNPGGVTFSLLQRFIRRNLGITAARKLFGETHAMRQSDPKLALELFLANAKLELEVNCNPKIALNVLNLAQKVCPDCFKNTYYLQAITKVLTLLGDVKQIRWVFQTALAEFSGENSTLLSTAQNTIMSVPTGDNRIGRRNQRNQQQQSSNNMAAVGNYDQLKAELQLWDQYLHAETVLGLSDVMRLDELRSRRDKVKVYFDEAERVRLGIVYATKEEARAAQQGIFHPAQDLSQRYDPPGTCTVWSLPEQDRSLQQRCTEAITHAAVGGVSVARKGLTDRVDHAAGADNQVLNMSTEFHLSLAGLPSILRGLLAKLPFHSGPPPDIDGFIRHMKGVILPPRPAPEESLAAVDAETHMLGDGDLALDADGAVVNGTSAPAWLGKHARDDAEDEQDAPDALLAGGNGAHTGVTTPAAADEDVFRKRKRTKKTT